MKIAAPVLAAMIAAPSVADSWSFGPSPLSLWRRPMVVMTPRSRLLTDMDTSLAKRGFSEISPRYEITDDDEKFQIAVDVPGMKPGDVHISVEDDTGMLSIEGSRESSGENYRFSSKFSQRFSLDPAVELDKFTAKMDDGVLVVSAPKDLKKIEASVRSIPITEGSTQTEDAIGAKDEKVELPKSEEAKAETAEPVKVEHHHKEEEVEV